MKKIILFLGLIIVMSGVVYAATPLTSYTNKNTFSWIETSIDKAMGFKISAQKYVHNITLSFDAGVGSGEITMRIEGDDGSNKPSGDLACPDGMRSIPGGNTTSGFGSGNQNTWEFGDCLLNASTQYHIVMNTSINIKWDKENPGYYSDGRECSNSGGGWSCYGEDWLFKVFGGNESLNQLNNYYPPLFQNINSTSDGGDSTEPYTTSDTTPTFSFNTNVNANCRIGDENINYTSMGSSRNCTSEQGTTNHICTLTVQDELIYSTDFVYIICENKKNASAVNTTELQMDIISLGDTTANAIDQGIQDSVIWPGSTVYSNQQVYLRNLNNDQVLATVDRVAVYGNQRWIFNYVLENESVVGLSFNITPVVYVLEMANISSSDVELKVASLINKTKN